MFYHSVESYVRGLKKAQRDISRMLKENAGGDQEELNSQLIDAAKDGDYETVKSLLNAGADANAFDEDGYTVLMYAEDERIARLLLAAGADVNVKNNNGETSLMIAASCGWEDIVRLLRQYGAKG